MAVVAAAFAVYAVLADYLRPAGAAAIVAAIAALAAALGGVLMLGPRRRGSHPEPDSLSAKALDFARAKPLLALGAAAALGVVAFRNPKLVTAAVTAFLAGKSAPKN